MSTAAPTRHPDLSLYDEDFYAWAMTTAALLRQRRFAEIDLAHLAEESEDLGKRERRVLEQRFGLVDGRTRTLDELGTEFRLCRERVRQIEATALRKMRHPERWRQLADFVG